ncbi:hypothetical protein BKD26_35690 [Streptomyces sp. CB03238]|nr:hypothetical protein BKD26_35690 [Streptomyces sp. CB03238]
MITTPDSADAVLRRELNDELQTGGPLWRLLVAGEPDTGLTHLFFTRNHAISDGHSTGAVVRALLDRLDGEEAAPPGGSGTYGDVGRTAPNADELPYRPPAWDGPAEPLSAGERPGSVPFHSRAPWSERAADFVPITLPPGRGPALKAWCRAREVTVNQFLAAALAESFAQATGRTDVPLCTAVSLRRRYAGPDPLPDVGCFINVVDVPLRVGDGGPAALALHYGAALRRADALWRPPRRDHATIRRAVQETAAATDARGVCITNVGVVDPALGPHAHRVAGFRTVVNRTGANYAMVLHVATYGGVLGLDLAYGTPSTDPATVRAVAKGLHDRAVRPGAPAAPPGGPDGGPLAATT